MDDLTPGTRCPTCERRINHPRTASSPKSAVVSLRLPADEHQPLKDTIESCAQVLGLEKEKYHSFKVVSLGLGLLLQHSHEVKEWLADSGV